MNNQTTIQASAFILLSVTGSGFLYQLINASTGTELAAIRTYEAASCFSALAEVTTEQGWKAISSEAAQAALTALARHYPIYRA